ncbi:MAG: hypothetical protein CBC13_09045 [Planctomycetia bacterium TMED53]|nr:MAG: hypothetical protein CBC13_09045 [Planctomycetia bacterium TMED53]
MSDSETNKLDQMLRRIRRRTTIVATFRSLEGALCSVLLISALLIAVDRFYEPSTDLNQKVWFASTVFVTYLATAAIRAGKSDIAGAVEVEKNQSIPQTISTAIFAKKGQLRDSTAEKVLQEAHKVSESLDVQRALPVGTIRFGVPTLVCSLVFAVAMVLPPIDLLGVQAEVENDRKENARVMRKEKALVRRLDKVEEVAKKHASEEVQKTIQKVAENQRKNLEKSKSNPDQWRSSEDLKQQLKEQKSRVLSRKKTTDTDAANKAVSRMNKAIDQIRQQSTPEMKRLAKALQEDDPGELATALDALAKKLSSNPSALGEMKDTLEQMLGEKLGGKQGRSGQQGPKDEGLVEDLEQLSRALKDLALLDQVKDQLEFTEAELSQLAKEWPKGEPPEICPDCLAGKCQAKSGGT